jgi:glycosyltransferase involved in cell wall biosynthesis
MLRALVAASVIITTYNQPAVLERALLGYARQDTRDFELLIADDGSGPPTAAMIARHMGSFPVPLLHVWQPDDGFRKARAVNLAVLRSSGECLIFSDGDCIPASDFVSQHVRATRPGQYVVGGHIRLSETQTTALTLDDVRSGRFETMASRVQRIALFVTHLKSLVYIALRKRRKPKFYGMNFSVDRASLLRVNGFDNNYRNSAREDSDLRNRMQLAGVRARSQWWRVGVFHQHHPPHNTRIQWREAAAYYERPDLTAEAPSGLRELQVELGQPEKPDPS